MRTGKLIYWTHFPRVFTRKRHKETLEPPLKCLFYLQTLLILGWFKFSRGNLDYKIQCPLGLKVLLSLELSLGFTSGKGYLLN